METLQELSERIDGLISSIDEQDLNDKEFISHKYMLVSLHAYTERAKLENNMKIKSKKLSIAKQYNVYKSMEEATSKKAHELTTEEMFKAILECKNMVLRCL
ncbi:MAG: hypothetical protein OEY52_04590 [Gammaproteobacteria bacterium]|nr:hypothetical protein [Gammaproteobacteria bacterium]